MGKTLTIKSNFRLHTTVRRDETVRLAMIVRERRTIRLCTPGYSDIPVQTCVHVILLKCDNIIENIQIYLFSFSFGLKFSRNVKNKTKRIYLTTFYF
jgi:hypothetical protein